MPWLGRTVRVIPVVILFVLATSCDTFFVSPSAIQSVTVTPTAILLHAGAVPPDTYQLASTAYSVGGTNSTDTQTATWSSNQITVATVGTAATSGTTPGLVTAPSAQTTSGLTATIKSSDGGKSGTASVLTYTGSAPTSMSIAAVNLPTGVTPSTIPAGIGFLLQASATFNGVSTTLNNSTSSYVTWTPGTNTTNATVDVNGNVIVPATSSTGTFIVNATAYFGSTAPQPSVTTSITLTVI